jgi:hypothetical protein
VFICDLSLRVVTAFRPKFWCKVLEVVLLAYYGLVGGFNVNSTKNLYDGGGIKTYENLRDVIDGRSLCFAVEKAVMYRIDVEEYLSLEPKMSVNKPSTRVNLIKLKKWLNYKYGLQGKIIPFS